jgi:hypothetical protein
VLAAMGALGQGAGRDATAARGLRAPRMRANYFLHAVSLAGRRCIRGRGGYAARAGAASGGRSGV